MNGWFHKPCNTCRIDGDEHVCGLQMGHTGPHDCYASWEGSGQTVCHFMWDQAEPEADRGT